MSYNDDNISTDYEYSRTRNGKWNWSVESDGDNYKKYQNNESWQSIFIRKSYFNEMESQLLRQVMVKFNQKQFDWNLVEFSKFKWALHSMTC